MSVSAAKSPTALISYSHDSPEHEQHVLELCNRLRARGVDAFVDQFLPGAPSEGWPLWMERQIESRDFTLMVCTEAYRRRFMEEEASGIGRGVVWEARILRNLLYEDPEWDGRIVPVLLESDAQSFVPDCVPRPLLRPQRRARVRKPPAPSHCASREPKPVRSDLWVRRAAAGAHSSGRGSFPTRCARAISPAARICSRGFVSSWWNGTALH